MERWNTNHSLAHRYKKASNDVKIIARLSSNLIPPLSESNNPYKRNILAMTKNNLTSVFFPSHTFPLVLIVGL